VGRFMGAGVDQVEPRLVRLEVEPQHEGAGL
jgi:hypothetical protein